MDSRQTARREARDRSPGRVQAAASASVSVNGNTAQRIHRTRRGSHGEEEELATMISPKMILTTGPDALAQALHLTNVVADSLTGFAGFTGFRAIL